MVAITKQVFFGFLNNDGVRAYRKIRLAELPQEVVQLGVILAFLQIFDGILTIVGVGIFGSHAEGNGILRMLMAQWGEIPTLMFVKSYAILVIGILCKLSSFVSWIQNALKAAIYLYLSVAVLPWSTIIIIKHLL